MTLLYSAFSYFTIFDRNYLGVTWLVVDMLVFFWLLGAFRINGRVEVIDGSNPNPEKLQVLLLTLYRILLWDVFPYISLALSKESNGNVPFSSLRRRLLMLNVKSWIVIDIPHYIVLARKLEFYEPVNSVQCMKENMSESCKQGHQCNMRGYVLIGFITWKS